MAPRTSFREKPAVEVSVTPILAGRIPPQNAEAEVSILGALLIDSEAIMKVADMLSPEDFYRMEHGTIFEAMQTLFQKRAPLDIVTLADELARSKKLEEVGGPAMLSSLVSGVATATNVQHYAHIVREKAMLRRLIHAAGKIGDLGFQEQLDANKIVDQAEQTLFSVTERFLKQNFVPVRSILTESFERLDALSKMDGAMRGIPTGYKHVDNILGGLQPADLLILAARPSMGKCLTGDVEILNPETGELTPIKTLVAEEQGRVATLSEWQFSSGRPSHFIDNGVKPTFKVVTALGREVETTAVHPFLTVQGWKPLKDLGVGDRIATPKALPFFGQTVWPEHTVATLAYFLSDGGLTQAAPKFTNVNPVIIADFKSNITKFPGVMVRMDDSNGSRATSFVVSADFQEHARGKAEWSRNFKQWMATQSSGLAVAQLASVSPSLVSQWSSGRAMPSRNMYSRLQTILPTIPEPGQLYRDNTVKEFLKEVGAWGKSAAQKTIPDRVLTLSRPNLALFLNRLFSCDGTAYVAMCAGRSFPVIAYCSVSKPLTQRVQHLLLRFGILAKVRTKQVKYGELRRTAYELEIHGKEDILAFAKEIGILGKEMALQRVVEAAESRKVGWTKDTIPKEVWQRIMARKGTRSWASIYRELGLSSSHNIYAGKRAPRRETVRALAQVLHDEELMRVANSEVYWDRIISITPTGNKQVYDLTIPETHNFVANDIVVHNTAFALNIAEYVAVKAKKTVGIFSLEMSKEQLVDRLISSLGQIDSWKLRNGKLNDEDFQNLNEAYGQLAEANLFIDDGGSATVMEVRAKARRLQAEHGLDLIVIDYLQLMSGSATHGNDNRVQEVSEISRSLKALAKEINCPVLALSQLSRSVESRPDKRPLLSDLRESGSIEQDADVVLFLYREDYYNKEEQNNIMEVLVRKHRNGPTGDAKLVARLQYSRFDNLDTQHLQQS